MTPEYFAKEFTNKFHGSILHCENHRLKLDEYYIFDCLTYDGEDHYLMRGYSISDNSMGSGCYKDDQTYNDIIETFYINDKDNYINSIGFDEVLLVTKLYRYKFLSTKANS